jgi:hypothetical protein
MPYGSLGPDRLSQASRLCMDKALQWWQKSMHTSKHKTFLIVAGYDSDPTELALRQQMIAADLKESEFAGNVIPISAANEIGLAQKIARLRELLPVETITVFAESRNAVSIKAIFRRKFRKSLQLRKFKADFEFNHQWITTSTPLAWTSRNWLLRIWFNSKKRMSRGLRKRLRYWFKG